MLLPSAPAGPTTAKALCLGCAELSKAQGIRLSDLNTLRPLEEEARRLCSQCIQCEGSAFGKLHMECVCDACLFEQQPQLLSPQRRWIQNAFHHTHEALDFQQCCGRYFHRAQGRGQFHKSDEMNTVSKFFQCWQIGICDSLFEFRQIRCEVASSKLQYCVLVKASVNAKYRPGGD